MTKDDQLVRAYGRQLLNLEIEGSKFVRPIPVEQTTLITYVRSTPNRRYFAMHLTVAEMDREPVTPSYIAKSLGISRNATNTMIEECEENDWIIVDRDENSYRKMYASELMTDSWLVYASWVAKRSNALGFGDIEGAMRLLTALPK